MQVNIKITPAGIYVYALDLRTIMYKFEPKHLVVNPIDVMITNIILKEVVKWLKRK